MKEVIVRYDGRLHSKKNSHQIHWITRGGVRVPTIGLTSRALDENAELRALAFAARVEQGWEMLDKTFFKIEWKQHTTAINGGDVDNVGTTGLDAFQGVLYTNDAYCLDVHGEKIIEPGAPEFTIFRIYIPT